MQSCSRLGLSWAWNGSGSWDRPLLFSASLCIAKLGLEVGFGSFFSSRYAGCAFSGFWGACCSSAAAAGSSDQPVLSQGSALEFRQACAHAEPRADQHRGGDAAALGGRVLGREPAAGAAAERPDAAGGRDHGPPDVRASRVRAGAVVSRAGGARRARRPSRVEQPRRGRAACGRHRRGRGGAALARDPARRRSRAVAPCVPRELPQAVPRGPGAAARGARRRRVSHHDERHRDARMPQPLRVLLPRDGWAAHAVSDARSRTDRRGDRGRPARLRRVHRQQPRARGRSTSTRCAARSSRSRSSGARP